MHIIIFDDIKTADFYPLTHIRSTGDLRCGIMKMRQRLQYIFGAESNNLIIDPFLQKLYRGRHPEWSINQLPPGQKLYLNSRIKLDESLIDTLKSLPKESALLNGDDIIAINSNKEYHFGKPLPSSLKEISIQSYLYSSLADIVHDNARLIAWDFNNLFYGADNYFETEPGVTVLHPYNIWLSENVSMAPNVVLDASQGPIVIDEGARIMANSVITGPVYIGKKTIVKIGAKIYGGVSVGPVCKIGGEIEGSIFQAYSNKQHDGFLGHSYIGEWVNMGADTNNSDLKNTYKNVKIYNYRLQEQVDSGTRFMGCILGDHVKTGINVSLNTGIVVGTGANIYGSDLFSFHIADFSWGDAKNLTKYRFDSFCQTAAIVKARRSLGISEPEMQLLKQIHGE
ncbi:MAG: hypothetical protein LHW48_10405 [Candidatus Cloacimonetes bacterium]|nr:hypothetical protein [Candidatus Cloacimonadota bacterium]